MIPLRPASLFRSRWAALFYAAGIMWFATDIAGTRDPAADNAIAPANQKDGAATDANLNTLEAQVHAFESLK